MSVRDRYKASKNKGLVMVAANTPFLHTSRVYEGDGGIVSPLEPTKDGTAIPFNWSLSSVSAAQASLLPSDVHGYSASTYRYKPCTTNSK